MTNRDPARLLLVTSNGAGMGHLTRMLAVALAAGDRAASTMLSMSVALPVVVEQGMAGEYCPSVERGWMSGPRWHGYLRERLVALVTETGADVVAFDGVAPYPGIGMARARLPEVGFVWVRRGMWRPGVNDVQLAKSGWFDTVVEPGELASAADRGATAARGDAVRVPPVSMLEVVEPLDRREAAAALGLDPDRPTALVTLGSGRLGDVEEPGRVVVSTLLEDPEWQVAVTRAAIAERHVPVVDADRIVELAGVYPLVRYLRAFDAVVSAAGYNAVHEFIPAGLPTLLVPNPVTRTDDQVARADRLAADGLALAAHPEGATALAAGVRRLSQRGVREALAAEASVAGLERGTGGAAAVAGVLTRLAGGDRSGAPDPGVRFRRGEWWLRERAKAALGVRGSNAVRRLMGRPPVQMPAGRLKVRMVTDARSLTCAGSSTTPLLFSERIPPEVLSNGPPVEQLLPGSSDDYRQERRRIANTYYDVTNRW